MEKTLAVVVINFETVRRENGLHTEGVIFTPAGHKNFDFKNTPQQIMEFLDRVRALIPTN